MWQKHAQITWILSFIKLYNPTTKYSERIEINTKKGVLQTHFASKKKSNDSNRDWGW